MMDLSPPQPIRRPDWIAITYVCRYWRSAALSLRKLWTCITPNLSISWSLAMMERSAPLPMHIDRSVGTTFGDEVEALAASGLLSASRIRSLRLSGPIADILKSLNYLCGPSPLESLSLSMIDMGGRVRLPETMCERNAPHFRRLTFETGMRIRAPLWLLTSVTHFTTHASVPPHELLRTLQSMPQLEVLCLMYTFSNLCYINAPKQLRAVLPRLSLLSVREIGPHSFLTLSSRIDAPPTLRSHLFWSINQIHGWEPSIFTDVQTLVPHDSAPGMDDGGLRAAQVTGGPARGSFEVWSRTDADTGVFAREDALFLFRLDWQPVSVRALDTDVTLHEDCPFFHLASLCAHLQTTRIEDLTVMHEASSAIESGTDVQGTPVVMANWQALLAALPSVKTLRLHRGSPACISVLRALAASPGLLPHLQKVFVVRCTVRYAAGSTAREGSVGVADHDSGSAMANHKPVRADIGADLVEAVSVRSGLEVVLVGCEVDEEALEALRKRAVVDFGKEWEYMQSVQVTLE